MKELKLTKYVQTNATVLDNEFIDHYMVRANGEYVKVYLLLLRHMNHSSGYLSVSELADLLECTEKDILRALRYWKSEGLLDYLDDTPDDPSPKSTAPSPASSSGLHDVQSGYMTSSIHERGLCSLTLQLWRLQRTSNSTAAAKNVQSSKNYCS